MGILAAIVIPSLLDVSSRPRSYEAKSTLGYVMRAQQVYHLEAVCKEALRTSSPLACLFGEFSQHQAN
jgi:Tfp pilus assembly protein PilE